jgi:hypothetical protein
MPSPASGYFRATIAAGAIDRFRPEHRAHSSLAPGKGGFRKEKQMKALGGFDEVLGARL